MFSDFALAEDDEGVITNLILTRASADCQKRSAEQSDFFSESYCVPSRYAVKDLKVEQGQAHAKLYVRSGDALAIVRSPAYKNLESRKARNLIGDQEYMIEGMKILDSAEQRFYPVADVSLITDSGVWTILNLSYFKEPKKNLSLPVKSVEKPKLVESDGRKALNAALDNNKRTDDGKVNLNELGLSDKDMKLIKEIENNQKNARR